MLEYQKMDPDFAAGGILSNMKASGLRLEHFGPLEAFVKRRDSISQPPMNKKLDKKKLNMMTIDEKVSEGRRRERGRRGSLPEERIRFPRKGKGENKTNDNDIVTETRGKAGNVQNLDVVEKMITNENTKYVTSKKGKYISKKL